MIKHRPTLSAETLLTWESQVIQYPSTGPAGIGYMQGPIPEVHPGYYVDCLLYRDLAGRVVGILNHYNEDSPPWERAGNVNLWVHPQRRRQGIATALWLEAKARWPEVTLDSQRFTPEGAFMANALDRKGLA